MEILLLIWFCLGVVVALLIERGII